MQELIKINRNDIPMIKKVAITGASAFAGDPGTVHLIPDEKKRANLHFAFEYFMRTGIAAGAEIYTTSPECEGEAVWLYSELKPRFTMMWGINPFLPLRCGWRFVLGSIAENRFAEKIKKIYAPRPHEYLALLAVDPAHQGKGYGSTLLRPVLQRLDEQNLPCYLETQNMKNVNMYRHFGFELVYETLQPKSKQPSFMMLRRRNPYVNPIHQKIWDMALEYQDKRNDPGHAEVALHFARILMELEKGEEDVIVPAIMLHDIGWSQLPDRMLVFDRKASKEDRKRVVLEHQKNSVVLARDILNKVGYDPKLSEEILEIISQHDTRKGFISKNEGLVRDADKLWRVSKRGVAAQVQRDKEDKGKKDNKDNKRPPKGPPRGGNRKGYYYSASAKKIDRLESEDRKKERLEKQ